MIDNPDDKLSRKEFFRKLGTFALIPLGYLWYSSVDRGKEIRSNNRQIKLAGPLNMGITFKDDVIISRDNKGIRIFSSRCTHLRCKLNNLENNEIVCSCHGSRFSKDGMVLKGPADSNLRQLEYSVDKSTKEIIVNVPV